MIGELCITHLFTHLGEIMLSRGALDKRGYAL
jgi:hypothetical protein